MRYIKKFNEDINVPIKVGDTVLGGRFKNKKIVVKKIGKNKKGDITVNDKPLLKFRLLKESISQEDIDNVLAYLKDDGFNIDKVSYGYREMIQIFKPKIADSQETIYGTMAINNMTEVNWSDIESDLLPFIELNKDIIREIIVTFPTHSVSEYDRKVVSADEILNGEDFGKILKATIVLNSTQQIPSSYLR